MTSNKRSSRSRNNATAAEPHLQQKRSATAFELHNHYSHKNIYPTFSTNFAVRQKYLTTTTTTTRSTSAAINHPSNSVRAYSTALFRATSRKLVYDGKGSSPLDLDDNDEDVIHPKRSLLTLLRIGMAYFGIEVLFSMETALAIPILLKLKVPESLYSFVYFLSPLFGFILQPIIGVMTDRCESRFGRRRPFILVLSLGAFVGITLILNSYLFGQWLGDKNYKIPYIAIVLVGLGVTFLDFSADSADLPLRAFVLDVCNPDDQDTGMNVHAVLGGTGAAFGYIVSAINWNTSFLKSIGDELQILYIFAAVIFIFTLTVTLTSVSEIPITLVKTNSEKMPLLDKKQNLLTLPEELFEKDENKEIKALDKDEDLEDETDLDQPITIKMLYQSIIKMPKELYRLMICQLFGWLGFFSVTIFMTDFVGQAIYHGDPSAPTNSTSFANYNDGVKMGCWCLLGYSLMTAISALILENFLLKKFSTRTLYFFSYLIYAICCGCIYFQTNIYIILPLCSSVGIIYSTIITLPYQMLCEFHKDKNYRNQSAAGSKRGLGVDCSLLSSCYFLSQTLISAFMGFLTSSFGNYVIVIVAALFSLAGCFWIALFVIFPQSSHQENDQNYLTNASTTTNTARETS